MSFLSNYTNHKQGKKTTERHCNKIAMNKVLWPWPANSLRKYGRKTEPKKPKLTVVTFRLYCRVIIKPKNAMGSKCYHDYSVFSCVYFNTKFQDGYFGFHFSTESYHRYKKIKKAMINSTREPAGFLKQPWPKTCISKVAAHYATFLSLRK